nr:TetR/AcrR family transcriptional regulator C-terminal ligand-binding domain-containing protein [Nocardia arthritidis]
MDRASASGAGVSKNIIYRWWPTKTTVSMDAFTDAFADRMEAPADGDALTRLRIQLRRVAQLMNSPEARRPFVALIAAAQHDPNWPRHYANGSSTAGVPTWACSSPPESTTANCRTISIPTPSST